jgi:hypothetical protein
MSAKVSFKNKADLNKNTRASTSKKWRSKGMPPIQINRNSWKSEAAHIAAILFQKNTRNAMLNNYNNNPYINNVLKKYYNGINEINYNNDFKKLAKNKLKSHMKNNVTRRINRMGAKKFSKDTDIYNV